MAPAFDALSNGEEFRAGFELSSWNFIGRDPKEFRHYGPMAQDFFSAFGQDGVGQIGTETTINSGDLAGILMVAVQVLEKRTAELRQKEARMLYWNRGWRLWSCDRISLCR